MATNTPAIVHTFETDYEGNTEVTVYATRERAERAAREHIKDWLDHEMHMLGIDAVWSFKEPERIEAVKLKAEQLWPLLDALNRNLTDKAIELYNEAGEEHDGDWSCSIEESAVRS